MGLFLKKFNIELKIISLEQSDNAMFRGKRRDRFPSGAGAMQDGLFGNSNRSITSKNIITIVSSDKSIEYKTFQSESKVLILTPTV